MDLYLCSQTIVDDYDTYDSCVIYANSEEEAKNISISELMYNERYPQWASDIKDIECTLLGKAKKGSQKGIIIASFNAG